MTNKAEKARGAKVRASRAKSRVTAKRKERSDAVKHASRKRTLDTYERAREKWNERSAQKAHQAAAEAARKDEAKTAAKTAEKKKGRKVKARPAREVPRSERRKERRGRGAADAKAKHVPAGVSEGEEKAKKKRRGKTHPARVIALGCLLLASLAGLLWIYTSTGVLNVKSVEVKGNEKLDSAYLESLSGITGDTHLLKMDVKAVEGALLSEPYVAAVDVSRRFPNTVVLEVTERQPSGFVFQNGRYNIVAQEGIVLESTDARPQGMVEIEGLELPLLLPGVEVSDADFATITSLIASMPPALREMAVTAGFMDGKGLYIESGDTMVIYGDATELSRKNTIALLALTTLVGHYSGVEYIDVSFPDHPVIKPTG